MQLAKWNAAQCTLNQLGMKSVQRLRAIASGGYGDASAPLLPWGNQKEKLYYYSSPTPGFENQTTAQRILRDWDVNTVITFAYI